MQFRCGHCRNAIQTPSVPGVARCTACAREFDLTRVLSGVGVEHLERDAAELARTSGIEPKLAASVLLGVTTLERAVAPPQPAPAVATAVADPVPPRPEPFARTMRFDPSFRQAVESGWLTAEQAAMRGTRDAFAKRLVERHGLTRASALEVADNRMSLAEAMRAGVAEPATPPKPRKRKGSGAWWLSVPLLAAAAVAAVVALRPADDSPAVTPVVKKQTAAPTVVASLADVEPTILRDESGQMTEIAAGHPRAILDTFCREQHGSTVDPVAIERAGDGWTGLYRQNGQLFGIAIRRDADRAVWVAGDAVNALHGDPVPTS